LGWIRDYGLYLAWLVALIATGGSLYFSEMAGFIPCELCWYQRILMYPLAVILGVASYRDDRSVVLYSLPLSLSGVALSAFHYLLQKVPGMAGLSPCKEGIPCSGQYINWLGFITIPFLAFVAFVLISLLLAAARKGSD
jgi:disulfide bond formation protein DsbB